VQTTPGASLEEMQKILLQHGWEYSQRWISKKLKSWRWSYKKVRPVFIYQIFIIVN
jgi:transposase